MYIPSSLNPILWRFTLFSSKSYVVFPLTLSSLIYFELLFVHAVSKGSRVIIWHVGVHFPHHDWLKRLPFSPAGGPHTVQKLCDHTHKGLFWAPYNVFTTHNFGALGRSKLEKTEACTFLQSFWSPARLEQTWFGSKVCLTFLETDPGPTRGRG